MKLGKWYVYHHINNGEVFYVGMGKDGRAYAIGRNFTWKEYVDNIPSQEYDIDIIKYFDDKKEALAFELAEIKRLSPKTNGNPRSHMRPFPRTTMKVYLQDYGVLKERARANKTSPEEELHNLIDGK